MQANTNQHTLVRFSLRYFLSHPQILPLCLRDYVMGGERWEAASFFGAAERGHKSRGGGGGLGGRDLRQGGR